jgi:hypothetical protein
MQTYALDIVDAVRQPLLILDTTLGVQFPSQCRMKAALIDAATPSWIFLRLTMTTVVEDINGRHPVNGMR